MAALKRIVRVRRPELGQHPACTGLGQNDRLGATKIQIDVVVPIGVAAGFQLNVQNGGLRPNRRRPLDLKPHRQRAVRRQVERLARLLSLGPTIKTLP